MEEVIDSLNGGRTIQIVGGHMRRETGARPGPTQGAH